MIGIKFDEIRDLTKICWISYIFNGFSSAGGCRRLVFGLATPQDGLVTPPVWGLCADLSEKRPEYVKVMEFQLF